MTDKLAQTIWDASRADDGTISATGADHVASSIREKFHLLERRDEPTVPVAYVLRSGPYLLDEHAGVMIDSSGNYSAKTRGNALALVVLLRAIADDIEDDIELGLKPEPVSVQHESYDPLCSEYRPPRGPDSQYLHDYNRGRQCPICVALAPIPENRDGDPQK